MKRSEMIYLIARTIYDNSMRSSIMETLPVAEAVLAALEASHVPPPNVCYTKNGWDDKKHSAYFYMDKNQHHWEEE